ncbi:DEAD/DEAH box helicase [Brevibacterium sp. 5221]|uniref:Probable DNA 3'-5' helicase RecG n=1 Tax=Brevibacterium rongguiense TaxID=2695267 RepID=A0A6N9H3K5_9MICO|nr:ATP-dependent DNA helicase RecG [Brevibacterium rongguiense]MYM18637.1 DEAD/DEAH box helicase [Brevibacterium rongguiense]
MSETGPAPRPPQLADLITAKRDVRALEKLGLYSLEDALRYFPRRYIYPGQPTPIRDLEPESTAVVLAWVVGVSSRHMRNRRGKLTTVTLSDGMGTITATFFNQPWLEAKLLPEQWVALTGKASLYRGQLQLSNPVLLNQAAGEAPDLDEISHPIPIYRASAQISTQRIQRLIRVLLDSAPPEALADPLPADVRLAHGLPDYRQALEYVHRPMGEREPEQALERFKFEEAFALQAELRTRRVRTELEPAVALPGEAGGQLRAFDESLPFELTASQRRAGTEISKDLASTSPMNRLLHGDVGSGKTLVALRAMLQAVDSGKQAALLAPTEVLAGQHFRSLSAMLGPLAEDGSLFANPSGVRLALLTGSTPAKERRKIALDLVAGEIDIVVGTHALLSDSTIFHDLGLVVVDEQHRFGVRQREQLRAKGSGAVPHTLVMTATPIPRTVAMTVFGDLDVSVLRELPGGPRAIASHVVSLADHPHWAARMWEVVGERVAAGQQAFVVASRIETQEALTDPETGEPVPEAVGVADLAERIAALPALRGARIEVLHGRLEQGEKDVIMSRFAHGEFDVLVATTVIEVGVDVPNARTMVIMDADRFGIAQLHQLRGRVGRAGDDAVCFFATNRPEAHESAERLATVAGTLDGFALADYDVEQRREGDVLGRSQWGARTSLRYLSVIRDEPIVLAARTAAHRLVDEDPELDRHRALRAYIDRLLVRDDSDWMETS